MKLSLFSVVTHLGQRVYDDKQVRERYGYVVKYFDLFLRR